MKPERTILCLLRGAIAALLLAAGAVSAPAGGPGQIDFAPWQHMPVLHAGRVKPVDTFARAIVTEICGRENPRLGLAGAGSEEELAGSEFRDARELFPEDRPRTFQAAELLLSWLVEPERWDRVPFLAAGNETLRGELLGLPLTDGQGNRLKYVSPYQLRHAPNFDAKVEELRKRQREARAQGSQFDLAGVDKKVSELYLASLTYADLTFGLTRDEGGRGRFNMALGQAAQTWQRLQNAIPVFVKLDGSGESARQVAIAEVSLNELADKWLQRDHAEPAVAAFRRSTAVLAERFHQFVEGKGPRVAGAGDERIVSFYKDLRAAAESMAEVSRLAEEAYLALFDSGGSLAIVPGLNPRALERTRDPEEQVHPWLGLAAVLHGSDALLNGYPQPELHEVRNTFRQAAAAYRDRQQPDRSERVAAALAGLASAVRDLGEAIEPLRQRLPVRDRDEDLIEATAYPPAGAMDLEVAYNRLDPFTWTWVLCLVAMLLLAISYLLWDRLLFWLGMTALAAGQAFVIVGLAMRAGITGWMPVANMFETVVLATLVAGLLGLWFAVGPLFWRGLKTAWRMTALPGTPEATKLEPADLTLVPQEAWAAAKWSLWLPRLALAVAVLILLTTTAYRASSEAIVKWLPRAVDGTSLPTFSNLMAWVTGLCLLAMAAWGIPRAILTVLVATATVPRALCKEGLRKPLERVRRRKPFALAAAGAALVAGYLACNVPTWDKNIWSKDIGTLQPILRDNFWLTVHVLTITASYGAGALAWGLGNLALGGYLFGRYRNPVLPATAAHRPAGKYQAPPQSLTRRAPEACAVIGTQIYKAMQVAVVLLAAGTILGALWADVAWGRFWGWDAKEVWALVSLLIYLAVLHGRYAGLFGNFGLAVGTVCGATSILMAWYGVNFVLGSGKHSYGGGAGGLGWVLAIVAIDWLFVLAAAIRYQVEVHTPVPPAPSEPDTIASL